MLEKWNDGIVGQKAEKVPIHAEPMDLKKSSSRKTHCSNIPVFHHSNYERSKLDSKILVATSLGGNL
jgi:hypothetical protein